MSQEQPSRTVPQRAAKVVREVAGYELLARLGEGGTGTVFKARQPGLERLVALKILSPQLAKEEEYLQRFRNEARAAARLNHPHIVQVLAAGYDEAIDVPYIIYEFVDGVSLTRLLEERGPLPERQALAVTRAVSEALGILSQAGLVHRDVKPDNILITREGTPKLADLGLAKEEADWETLTATGIVMGTPDYMAPEQATGKRDLTLATDYYALGLTLYVMLTAELPYQGETLVEILTQHIQKDCPDPRQLQPGISRETSKLVALMTRRQVEQRYDKPPELQRDIDLIMAGKAILGPNQPRTPKRLSKPGSSALAKRRRATPDRGAPARSASGRSQNRSALASEAAVAMAKAGPGPIQGAPDQSPETAPAVLRESARRRDLTLRRRSFTNVYILAFCIGGLLAFLFLVLPRLTSLNNKAAAQPAPTPNKGAR